MGNIYFPSAESGLCTGAAHPSLTAEWNVAAFPRGDLDPRSGLRCLRLLCTPGFSAVHVENGARSVPQKLFEPLVYNEMFSFLPLQTARAEHVAGSVPWSSRLEVAVLINLIRAGSLAGLDGLSFMGFNGARLIYIGRGLRSTSAGKHVSDGSSGVEKRGAKEILMESWRVRRPSSLPTSHVYSFPLARARSWRVDRADGIEGPCVWPRCHFCSRGAVNGAGLSRAVPTLASR